MIKYRAVHERAPWRKVGIHKTIETAVDGPDGAKRLLKREGRVGKKWEEYGPPLCVFVWDDESTNDGIVFRLVAGQSGEIESAHVAQEVLEKLEKQRSCSALELDGFFDLSAKEDAPVYPDELTEDLEYTEGAIKRVSVNAYERDAAARFACIAHFGSSCCVCGVDFGERYGSIGQGFIHVHHLNPVASKGVEHKIDPIRDLRPVCPNCHAMLHKKDPPYKPEELKEQMESK
jgi:predicted HNH restriction endonuclease